MMAKYHPVEYMLMVVTAPIWIPLLLILVLASVVVWSLLFTVELYSKVME